MNHLQIISDHLAPALLVIFRIGGLMIYGPVFGSSVVPVRLKIFLSFVLGLAAYPLLNQQFLAGRELSLDLWSLGPLMAVELLIGMVVGFVASLPMVAVQTGGLMMGQQMGLGFARFYNPAIDDEADVIGQVLFFLALAMFLSIGGHEAMLLAVFNSFQHIPLGQFAVDVDLLALLTGMLLAALEIALRIAAPLLALVFLESLAMGFIAKTVPQLNILSLGFPLRIIAGFALVSFGVVIISEVMMEGIDQMLTALFAWVESQ